MIDFALWITRSNESDLPEARMYERLAWFFWGATAGAYLGYIVFGL